MSETIDAFAGASLTEQCSGSDTQQTLDLKQVDRRVDVFLEKMAYCRLPIGDAYGQLLTAAQHLKSEITARIAHGEDQSPGRFQKRLDNIQNRYNALSSSAFYQQSQNLIASIPTSASSSQRPSS